MKLFNTLTRQVESLQPQSPPLVTLYTCGPTVYDYLTIGNWTAYIRWDLLARTLRDRDHSLNWYMNITDVGHLVSDADEGEDKLEKGARREGKTAWEVAEFYTADFIQGLKDLNITVPLDHLVKATDHIPEQIALIKSLEDKGYTYTTKDGVYFDSSKFETYGALARLDITGLQAGARVELGDKHAATDFALWKFSPIDSRRDMEWDSPWGKGFPGWHIECSAMAMHYLGETLDIHAGGIDHIPVHHTNEIAQSEASTGKPFAHIWLHSNFLQIDNEKIAKSAGNGYTLSELYDKGFSPNDLRVFILQSHYRSHANFTWEALGAARNRLRRWQSIADVRWQLSESFQILPNNALQTTSKQIRTALAEDLDSPAAYAAIESGLSMIESGVHPSDEPQLRAFLETVRDLLGIDLLATPDISKEQREFIVAREAARKAKDWVVADRIRSSLEAQQIEILDSQNRSLWRRDYSK